MVEIPQLGVCYYPEHWDRSLWKRDAERMAEIGIGFARIGEFAWALMEPEPGQFNFAWLDDAIDNLHAHGLQVMLGTPTATPPKWLMDQHTDILAVDEQGQPRGFGSRRHYCFSSDTYRDAACRITEVLAKRYGNHPAVTLWQTDNEFGCHDTVRSYSPMARDAFRLWLADRYGDVGTLNEAWGNVFWSMLYRNFDEIELPNLTVTEANPSHWLDFCRFSSDQVIRFHKAQAEIIRQHAPDAKITHNAMGHYTHYDHFALGDAVDILTWDSYPLGFLSWSRKDEEFKRRFLRQGDPDFAAFHHDLYRGCADFAVIEQQPGPVNWAPDNPIPLDGMLRLWSHEALAHGAEFTAPFRWRQAPFAQEQNHAGLLRPDDKPAQGYSEIAQVSEELDALRQEAPQADVALLYDYDSLWMAEIQPQGSGWNSEDIAVQFYTAARRLGANIDIVRQGTDLSGYKAVIVPALLHVNEATAKALEETSAHVLMAPRAGSKDAYGRIVEGLAPGPLRRLIDVTVVRSESVPAGSGGAVGGGGAWRAWRDEIETDLEPTLKDDQGRAVLYRNGRTHLLAALPGDALLLSIMSDVFQAAGLASAELSEGLRIRKGRGLTFAFNYSAETQEMPEGLIPDGADLALGENPLPPAGIAAWRAQKD